MYHLNLDKKLKKIFDRKKKIPFPNIDLFSYLLLLSALLLLGATLFYIVKSFNDLGTEIPLFSSLPSKINQLSVKKYIYVIPFIQFAILVVGGFYSHKYLKINLKIVARFVAFSSFLSTLVLFIATSNIISKSSAYTYSLNDAITNFVIPFILAFFISSISTNFVVKYSKKLKIIEYPAVRNEPQKVLQVPTSRGGSIGFFIAFALCSMIFLGGIQRVWGLIIGIGVTTITGYLDDRYKLGYLIRLIVLLPGAFLAVILSGFVMLYIPNPLGETIKLDTLRLAFTFFGDHSVIIYGAIASFLWFMWITNMMSWNNGIDGQFVAISSVALAVLGFLSLRTTPIPFESLLSAKLAFIGLGAVLGLLYFTFPPQKILWGFGATGVGLLVGAISILSGTRVAAASIVLLIPSIDTIWVIINRIKNKKVPFLGDRNHLHHKLLDIGLSRKQIAFFYWVVSLLFGAVSIFSSEKDTLLTLIIFSGVVLYLIIAIRLYSARIVKTAKNYATGQQNG